MKFVLPSAFAFIDTETTGTNPRRDRVIEIGIIRVENGREVARIDTLLNPHSHLPPEIYALTGISYDQLLRAPDFDEIQSDVRQILDGALFVAHNARFDYAFVKNEFTRHENDFRAKVLCTVKLTRKLFPNLPKYSLASLINYFGFNPKARHRALADAEVLWELYKRALEIHGDEKVAEALSYILKTPSLPSNLSCELVDELPEAAGIYIFYGETKDDSKSSLPLYIGKSVNIKDRVKSHFSGDHANTSDLTMSSQIKKIETVVTAGEVGALIRETDAIKSLMPVYNKKLRQRRNLVASVKGEKNGLYEIELKEIQELSLDDQENVMAVFSSTKKAKESLSILCKEYLLCLKLMGLEKTKGRCFGSQIGICNGVCAGDEDPKEYNKRFMEAFSKTKVKKWPFKGAIVMKEQTGTLCEMHVIDNWRYLGSVVYDSLELEPKVEKYTPRFDWDIYKILVKAVIKLKVEPVSGVPELQMLFENTQAMRHSHPFPF